MRKVSVLLLPLVLLTNSPAVGASDDQLDPAPFDRNHDGLLDYAEAKIYLLHKRRPDFAALDTNRDGIVDEQDNLEKIRQVANQTAAAELDKADFKGALGPYNSSPIEIQKIAPKPPQNKDFCVDAKKQRVFIRKDRFDGSMLEGVTPRDKAQGASIGFTNDNQVRSQSGTINAYLAYAVFQNPCDYLNRKKVTGPGIYGYASGPAVLLAGNWNSNTRQEKNAMQIGWNADFGIVGGPFDYNRVSLLPYYQTDFRGNAQGYGFKASLEPFKNDLLLGAGQSPLSDPRVAEYFSAYWRVQAETDQRHYDDFGNLGLSVPLAKNYSWFGGAILYHVDLFPDIRDLGATTRLNVSDEIRGRLHFDAAFRYYWDANSQREINFYSAAFSYDLSADHKTSISVAYNNGTQLATLSSVNQWIVTLNYKY